MFKRNESGNVAILFGLMLPALMAAIGGGIEVSRAVEYKQRLTSAADLSCRQAEVWVESTQADDLTKNYKNEVQAYADKNATEKNITTPATITAVPTPAVKPTLITVTAKGSIDLVFKSFVKKDSVDFTVTRTCTVDVVTPPSASDLMFSESFEEGHSVARDNWTVLGKPNEGNVWTKNDSDASNDWKTQNGGIEINGQPQLTGDSIRFGNFFAELDSHCYTSGCRTNSAMSRILTLDKGTYDIRYWYVARKNIGNIYSDALICAKSSSTTGAQRNSDVAWANKEGQTHRIEVYVEKRDNSQGDLGYDFNQANMVDVCVWADVWTERKYTFTVSQKSEYRISWRAAGREDTYGGLIDYLRLCKGTCK